MPMYEKTQNYEVFPFMSMGVTVTQNVSLSDPIEAGTEGHKLQAASPYRPCSGEAAGVS